jgi:large conductance mechanosensitive channel
MKIIQEFKAFAMRGNVVDLAVGIIIGTAFGKIVSALVASVIMPPIGLLLWNVDFSSLQIVLKDAVVDAAGKEVAPAVAIGYGLFINTIIDFLIVAAAIFLFIKAITSLKRMEEAKPTLPPEPTKQELLLGEIRDILKAQG